MELGQPLSEAAPTGNAEALADQTFLRLSARDRWAIDKAAELFRPALALAPQIAIKGVDDPEDRAAIIANRWARNVLWYGLPFEARRKIQDLRKAEREAEKAGRPIGAQPSGAPAIDYGAAARA